MAAGVSVSVSTSPAWIGHDISRNLLTPIPLFGLVVPIPTLPPRGLSAIGYAKPSAVVCLAWRDVVYGLVLDVLIASCTFPGVRKFAVATEFTRSEGSPYVPMISSFDVGVVVQIPTFPFDLKIFGIPSPILTSPLSSSMREILHIHHAAQALTGL